MAPAFASYQHHPYHSGLPTQNDLLALEELQNLLGCPCAPGRDLLALALWPYEDAELREALASQGVSLCYADCQQMLVVAHDALQPELLLVDPNLIDEYTPLPERFALPIIALSAEARGAPGTPIPAWMRSALVMALERARAAETHLRQRRILDSLGWNLQRIAAMSRIIAAAPTPGEAVQQLMQLVRDLFNVEAGTLYRYDAHHDQLVFEVVFGSQHTLLKRLTMPAEHGLAGAVLRNGEPLLISDVAADPRFAGEFDLLSGFETRSMLCVPMEIAGHRWGVLQLINKLNGEFTAADLLTLRMVSFLPPVIAALEAYEAAHEVGV